MFFFFGLVLIQLISKRGTFFSANLLLSEFWLLAYGWFFWLPIQIQHVGALYMGGFSDSQSEFDIWVFRLFRSVSLLNQVLLLLLDSLSHSFFFCQILIALYWGFHLYNQHTPRGSAVSCFLCALLNLVSVLSISIFSLSPTLTA